MRPLAKISSLPLTAFLLGFLLCPAAVSSLYGIQLNVGQFSSSDSVITFETASTALPSVPGVQFAGGDATFSYTSGQCFGSQYFGDINEEDLDIYFSTPQQAVGAYLVQSYYGSGVREIVYDQSNNVIETESASFGYPLVFLGIGEPTAQIYHVKWQLVPSEAYFGVDNVTYGSANGLSQMPNIPTGLKASLQGTAVALNWNAASQATSYTVERGTASGGPYSVIATGVTGTTYKDTTATNGGTYYYVVTAVNSFGQSAISQEVIAFIVDHFAFASITSPQTSSVPFTVTISACDSKGALLTNFNGAAMLGAYGDYGTDQLAPAGTSAFLNGQWTGAVTVAASNPDSNMRLTSSSNGVSGTSSPFNVVAPPIQELGQAVADMVYNPFNKLIYATVPANPGGGSANGNSLITIDPYVGRIVGSNYLGNNPGAIALSGDGQFLYIGFYGTNTFERFNLFSNVVDLQASVGMQTYYGLPYHVTQFAVLPGQPHSVAIAENTGGPGAQVVIFDDGTQRPNIAGLYNYSGTVVAASPTQIYAGAPFSQLTLDQSGVTNSAAYDGLVGLYDIIAYQGGEIFTPEGSVFNAETLAVNGTLPNSYIVEPDLAAGRIYSMGYQTVPSSPNAWTIYSWNPTNFQQIGSLPLADNYDIYGGPTAFIRWGTNGLAFNDLNSYMPHLILIRTPLIPLVQPTINGGVAQTPGSFQLDFTGDVAYPYTIWASTNFLNWTKVGVPNLISNDWLWFSDSNALHYSHRFYRVSVP